MVKRVIPEGKTMCGLCSRLRRGVIYRVASELGATKIALGHHRDDILETFFLNLFFGAKLKAMPPKLLSDDGRHVVIRPLAYVAEDDLARYAEVQPISDHSLRSVRIAGQSAARAGQSDARRIGRSKSPGRIETHVPQPVQRHAVAPAGPELFDFAGIGTQRIAFETAIWRSILSHQPQTIVPLRRVAH